jgi:hypothetical protein
MKNHITQADQSQPDAHQSSAGEHPLPSGHHHERFLTAEELDALFGDEVRTAIDTELAVIVYERHLMRIAQHGIATHGTSFSRFGLQLQPLPSALVTADPIAALGLLPPPSRVPLAVLPQALRYPRVNHRTLNQGERNRFNRALQQAHLQPTTIQLSPYAELAAIHANMTVHRMHSMHGAVGTQRFLPWHRLYLLKCEKLLQTYEPLVRIPYWDYANDRERPDWVWQPPNVNRGTPGTGSLPDQQTMNFVQNNPTYTGFTSALEANAHNDVHNWCNGTISSPPTAAQDPIFWLLHANVDRLWNLWQATHNGAPLLNGIDAVLDPWQPTTATDVDSILNLGYWYSGVGFAIGPIPGV